MQVLEQLLDLYDVRYQLSRMGEQAVRCPVHEDMHASASLNLDKQVLHCLACGFGGGPTQLVMAREGLTRAAAERRIQELTGVIPARVRGQQGAGDPVPAGSGYKPRYRREDATGARQRPSFGGS
ncbi:MAG: hypothetical protein IPG94_22485 [Kineosporiaceae bacterium]|nr:hypothetical protein [Kineosporiaceae bacterium]